MGTRYVLVLCAALVVCALLMMCVVARSDLRRARETTSVVRCVCATYFAVLSTVLVCSALVFRAMLVYSGIASAGARRVMPGFRPPTGSS